MSSEPDHTPAAPDVQRRIRELFDSQALMRYLGATLDLVAMGRVHIALTPRPEIAQQHGFVHAGATCAIGDSAGEYAAVTLLPEGGGDLLGIEYKVNFLAPAKGDYLEAVGTVVKSGRTLSVCAFQVWGVEDSRRSLIATGQQTLIRVEGRANT